MTRFANSSKIPGACSVLVASLLCFAAPRSIAVEDASTAWRESIRKGDTIVLMRLISPSLDVGLSGPKGKTALMVAASRGDLTLIRRLLELGADVNQRNDAGGTALMYAAQYGQTESADLLLVRGAAPDIQAAKSWTAIMIAVLKGHQSMTELLLEQGADPNLSDMLGWTPLMRAVANQQTPVVDILLGSERVAVNAYNLEGVSALHIAAALGDIEITRRLLAHGADPGVRDGKGNTPSMLAEQAGHGAVHELLEQHSSHEAMD